MFPSLTIPVDFAQVSHDRFNVFRAGTFIGHVRKAGYHWDAFDASGLTLHEGCKTRAHASLWLVRAIEQMEALGEQA